MTTATPNRRHSDAPTLRHAPSSTAADLREMIGELDAMKARVDALVAAEKHRGLSACLSEFSTNLKFATYAADKSVRACCPVCREKEPAF